MLFRYVQTYTDQKNKLRNLRIKLKTTLPLCMLLRYRTYWRYSSVHFNLDNRSQWVGSFKGWLLYSRWRILCRLRLKCDGTSAETRFRLSAKRTSPFKSARVGGFSSVDYWQASCAHQPAGFVLSCKPAFCSHVTLTGYPFHLLVSPSLLLPCVTVCHNISNAVYTLKSGLDGLIVVTAREASKQNGRT
jgi:hypothetical protein